MKGLERVVPDSRLPDFSTPIKDLADDWNPEQDEGQSLGGPIEAPVAPSDRGNYPSALAGFSVPARRLRTP